jgi:hypothetical protein
VKRTIHPEDEKDYIDIVTHAMLSTGFLADLTAVLASGQADQVSVGQFYREWCKKANATDFVPFSLGAVFGHLCAGIMFVKENWFDLIPEDDITTHGAAWGLDASKMDPGPKTKMNVRGVVRRLRNAIGHGNFRFHVPEGVTRQGMMRDVKIEMWDVDTRDSADTFSAKASLDEVCTLVKALQKTVHDHLKQKYGVTGR